MSIIQIESLYINKQQIKILLTGNRLSSCFLHQIGWCNATKTFHQPSVHA